MPTLDQKSAPIIGAWKLISLEIQRENGEVTYPFGKNAQGTVIYTESGRFSLQLMRTDRPQFASGDQMRGTSEEVKANYEGFVSYYGSRETEGGKKRSAVTHLPHVKYETSSFQNFAMNVGTYLIHHAKG